MRKKNAKILNAFEQKIQTNQSKNLYHQNNKNKHYLYAKINGKKYKTVAMVRIKPNAIRQCNHNCYIVNGNMRNMFFKVKKIF